MSNFSYAQNTNISAAAEANYCKNQSSVCGTAPEQFTFLMDFVREMMNSIKTMGTQWEYLGKYVNPNRFKWNAFTPPKKTTLGRLARNIWQKLQFGAATAAIIWSPANFAWLKDMFGWVILLFKNRVFLRDSMLIQTLESNLNNKKYELGLWWWRYETVNSENSAILQSIITTYINKWLLLPASKIHPGVTYENVASLLTQVLSSAKTFLYLGTTSQMDSMSRWSSDQSIFVAFSGGAMTQIKRDYTCARWPNYICSSQHMTIKKVFSTMWKSLSSGASSSRKTIKDATKRLGMLFTPSQQDDSYKAREQDLLRSIYGSKKISKWTLINVNWLQEALAEVKSVWAAAGELWTAIVQVWSGIWTSMAAIWELVTYRSSPSEIKDTFTSNMSLPAPTFEDTDISKIVDSYLLDVFNSQQTDLDLVSMNEVKGVTPAFQVLGTQVSVIKNDILGGKDTEKSLLKYLWAACELQCGRWWRCR